MLTSKTALLGLKKLWSTELWLASKRVDSVADGRGQPIAPRRSCTFVTTRLGARKESVRTVSWASVEAWRSPAMNRLCSRARLYAFHAAGLPPLPRSRPDADETCAPCRAVRTRSTADPTAGLSAATSSLGSPVAK